MTRAVLWLVRKLLMVAPCALIAFWGFAYLKLCYFYLLNPHRSVELIYKAVAGDVRVHADSYLIDPRSGRIYVRGLRLYAPKGGVVASTELVTVSNLDPYRGANQNPMIDIFNLSGTLVRLKDGKFQLVGLLPPSQKSESKVPFQVTVHNAEVLLVDQLGSPWQQRVQAKEVKVFGLGPNWVAFGNATLPGMGQVSARVQNAAEFGVQIEGHTDALDGTLAARHFLTDPELKIPNQYRKIAFRKATASGPFQIFVPNNKRVSFHTSIAAMAQDVSYSTYHLNQAEFAGQIGLNGMEGKARAELGQNRAQWIGSVNWQKGIVAAGSLIAKTPSPASLPREVSKYIPKGIDFTNAEVQGWVGLQKGLPLAQAQFSVDRAVYRSEVASNAKGLIFVDSGRARVDVQHVLVAGKSPVGSAWLDLKKKSLLAYVQGDHLRLEDVGRLTHTAGLSGDGSAKAIVTGPFTKPVVEFLASASASYRHDKYSFGPDQVQVAGTYHDNRVNVHRGYLHGIDGLLAVSGSSSSTGQSLDLDIEARKIHPGRYVKGLDGVASLSANVKGNYLNPLANGVLRGEDLKYRDQEVPAAVARFMADKNHVEATSVQAISGTMDLDGHAAYILASKKLSGKFSLDGVELTQFLGDKAAGILNVPTIQLSGTLQKPMVVARAEGSNLIFGDVLIENLEALATGDLHNVVLDHATANFAGGSISANGTYDIAAKSGNLTASSTPLDLSKLAPLLGEQITVKGNASLTDAKVAYKDGAFSGNAKGKLEKVYANGAPAGDGNWTAAIQGDDVSGEVSIGELIPELRVIDLTGKYNLKTKYLDGTFESDRARLKDLIAGSLRYLPGITPSTTSSLLSASGDLTVGATFKGPVSSPDISIDTLALNNILYKEHPFGSLTADKVVRSGGKWDIPNLQLAGPEGTVSASGKVEESGALSVDVTGKGIAARAFTPFSPNLETSAAVGDFQAKISGATKSPDVVASGTFNHLVTAPATGGKNQSDQDLTLTVSKASLSGGTLGLEAKYKFDGFTGALFGTVPFSYTEGFGDSSVQGHLVLDKRDLKDLPLIDQIVDRTRSSGTILGDIAVSGPIDRLAFDGGISLSAETLGLSFANSSYIKKVDDEFKKAAVNISITRDRKIAIAATADEIRGGSVYLNVSAPIPDFAQLLKSGARPFSEQLNDIAIAGEFGTKNLNFRQSAPGGFVAGAVDGKTSIGGTIGRPNIGSRDEPGTFTLTKVDTTLPTFPSGSGTGTASAINPTFNLAANLGEPAHIKSATADLYLSGGASLKGSLSTPVAAGNLVVARGTIRLPGGTVRLTEGGTVDFGYRHTFAEDSVASLNVDLEGRTSITAIRYGQNTQRYDITLDITGDLLQDNGLHFNAISDPPDLSSDDVLALLGEKSLLESLGNTDQSETEKRVRDALVGFALPSLLDPYTSTLAHSLGLDYLSLEYNSFDLATINVARALSRDFTLQYRQQVGTPPPGYRAIYDFRIVYSPRKGPALFRRLSLSAGFDQDRPWKAAVEYGTRFGGYSGPSLKNKTVISSPAKP